METCKQINTGYKQERLTTVVGKDNIHISIAINQIPGELWHQYILICGLLTDANQFSFLQNVCFFPLLYYCVPSTWFKQCLV